MAILAENEIKAPPRWCRDCKMDLFLSGNPTVDDDVALCDICSERIQIQHGGSDPMIVEVLEIKEKLRDYELELEEIEDELDQLERDKRDLEWKIRGLEKRLKDG